MSLQRRKRLRSNPETTAAWQQRSRKTLKRSRLGRASRIMRRLTAKGKRKRAFQMGDAGPAAGLGDLIRALPCVGCHPHWWRRALELERPPEWPRYWQRCDVAHLVKRDAGHGVRTAHPTKCGRPAGVPCVVPLERRHHERQEGRTAAFSREIRVPLWDVATLVSGWFAGGIRPPGFPENTLDN